MSKATKLRNKRAVEAKIAKLKRNRPYYMLIVAVVIVIVGVIFVENGFSFDFSDNNKSDKPDNTEVITVTNVDALKVTFIDVGQGDAIWINFPDGKNMLIDAGEDKTSVRNRLDEYLRVDGNKQKIDYCVATHADSDHIGSLRYVYDNYDVGYSYRPYIKSTHENANFNAKFNAGSISKNTKTYLNYIEGVYNEHKGSSWEFFDDKSDFTQKFKCGEKEYSYSVDFKMGFADSYEKMPQSGDNNNYSAIISIEFENKRILLVGDMEADEEKNFITYYSDRLKEVDCDVLKVGHHGSDTSSSDDFLKLVKPEYAVISCGVGNSYHH
ncbi:MAG: MBL fold metallo-hydrolase, partial [Clostridia bacterium]|nr:MBL fold metallo-hydrolase [Clostridia bacterium]